MSERFNQNQKLLRALQKQESSNWFQRRKHDLDRRSQSIAQEMRGVFSGYMLTPVAVLAGEVQAMQYQYDPATFNVAYQIAGEAFRGNNGDPWQMFTGAMSNTEGKRREGGRMRIESQHMLLVIIILLLAAMILGACTPPGAGATYETGTPTGPTLTSDSQAVDATVTATVEPTNAPTLRPTDVPATPTPELAATEGTTAPTLQPTDETPLSTVEGGSSPIDGWEVPFINDRGDYSFACQIESISYDVVEILPGIDATGFIICNGQKIPAGIYDRNANTLFYWDMMPINNPEVVDYLGERAIERLVTQFGFGRTYLDGNKLIGANVIASVGLPSVRNRNLVNAINIGRYTGEYYSEQSIIDVWATTGKLPNDKPCLYPYSLDFTN